MRANQKRNPLVPRRLIAGNSNRSK